jgi:hypothetical protein
MGFAPRNPLAPKDTKLYFASSLPCPGTGVAAIAFYAHGYEGGVEP